MTSNKKWPSAPALRLQAARGCKPATPTKATSVGVAAAQPTIQRLLPLPTKDLDCAYALHKFDRLANRGDLADSPPRIGRRACAREIGGGGNGDDEKLFAPRAFDLKRCRAAIVLVPRRREDDQQRRRLQTPPHRQNDIVRGSSGSTASAASGGADASSAAGSTAGTSAMPADFACRGQRLGAAKRHLRLRPPEAAGALAAPALPGRSQPSFPESASASPASSTASSGCDEDGLSSTGGRAAPFCNSPDESACGLLLACSRESAVSPASSASREPSVGSGRVSRSSFGRIGGDSSTSGDGAVSEDGGGVPSSGAAEVPALLPCLGRDRSSACKWLGCSQPVGESDLLRHMREQHLQRQPAARRQRPSHCQQQPPTLALAACDLPSTTSVSCLWLGCKVYGRESRSRAWLDGHVLLKHVPGAKPFCCIVAGCDKRFGSRPLLARHVAAHFDDRRSPLPAAAAAPPGAAAAGHARARPTACEAAAGSSGAAAAAPKPKKPRKMLKGLQPCIRKTEDFIDPSMFNLMQEQLYSIGDFWEQFLTPEKDDVTFASEVIGQRTDASGRRQLLLHWHPPDVLDDCWVAEEEEGERSGRHRTRTVSVDQLRQMLHQSIDFSPPACVHGSRKSSATGGQLRRFR